MASPSREKRWIILCEDGRHVTVGRHSDPTEAEISRASEELRALGVGAWLAISEGRYYGQGELSVMMVRPLHQASAPWDSAVAAFLDARKQANAFQHPHNLVGGNGPR